MEIKWKKAEQSLNFNKWKIEDKRNSTLTYLSAWCVCYPCACKDLTLTNQGVRDRWVFVQITST